MSEAWSPEEFLQKLRDKRRSYHLEHPFEARLAAGQLSYEQLQMWAANRFYYQANIPRKDAYILANCPDAAFRRQWLRRLVDQDGEQEGEGGIEAWLRLGEGLGLPRAVLLDFRHVLPGVRFAVDAYVAFARRAPWQEAVCASLTELFAPEAHAQRLAAFPRHYPEVPSCALDYFQRRLSESKRDSEHGLRLTLAHFTTRPLQDRALEILQMKIDILWAMAEAIYHGYCRD